MAEPPPDLRRRLLDACRRERRTAPPAGGRIAWWSWQSWRPEMALCCAIVAGLATLFLLRTADARSAFGEAAATPAAPSSEVAQLARRLARSVDQGEPTAEYLAVQLARNRRVLVLESTRRFRDHLRIQRGRSPWS